MIGTEQMRGGWGMGPESEGTGVTVGMLASDLVVVLMVGERDELGKVIGR